MTYRLPELDYKLDALEPALSSEILELHHGKHHATYVKGANQALEDLAAAREKGDFKALNQLEKDLAFNLSGHVLHSLFWKNMNPDGGGQPEGELKDRLTRDFGSVDVFRKQFSAAALGVQGSGWAGLSYDPLGQRLLVHQIHDHQDNYSHGTLVLLVLDMWEHAYYLQYQNGKAKWAEAFWDLVSWSDVAQRLQRASSSLPVAAA